MPFKKLGYSRLKQLIFWCKSKFISETFEWLALFERVHPLNIFLFSKVVSLYNFETVFTKSIIKHDQKWPFFFVFIARARLLASIPAKFLHDRGTLATQSMCYV